MLILIAVHLVATLIAPVVIRVLGRRGFWLLALPSLSTAAYALVRTSEATSPAGAAPTDRFTWVESLSLEFSFRLDSLSWLLCLLVGGIGALVLLYCSSYFDDDEPDLSRFAAYLTGFAGAMTGLVLADDLLVLYIFWELTTVLSFLLIGHASESLDARVAATQALVVTTAGGLTMFVGIVMLGQSAGTYELSAIAAHPPSGPLIPIAVVLVLVGAITKSALVPFHFWLPGAMAAPTPVSAYLHAAAMVKAGVYLVARLAPIFAEVVSWRPVVLVLGCATMIVGGYRALRQVDLKLLLAYGTVSQLGFLTVLVGTGSRAAALAGLTLVLAHAVFKCGLFLTVGAIDHATGTRDLRHLSGLRSTMPWLCAGSVLCAASMAGLPPLLGFVGKEVAYAAYADAPDGWSSATLAVLVIGSILTFAYSARFVWGAWVDKPGVADTEVHHLDGVLVGIPTALGLMSLLLGPLSTVLEPAFAGYVERFPATDHEAHLGLWHGWSLPLLLSAVTVILGLVLYARRTVIELWQAALPHPPAAVSGYRLAMRGLDRGSMEVTGFLQRGSLPLSVGLILSVFVALPGGAALLAGTDWQVRWWDSPAQAVVAGVVSVAAIAAARSRRRLRGVLLVGVTGYGSATLFLLHGAPDLALTQILAETVSLVVFVLVLRRFSGRFSEDPTRRHKILRPALGVATGVAVSLMALVASSVRTAAPGSVDWPKGATGFGGGENIVNVALVDIRAWDTMGEISVVLVAATGIASLIFLSEEPLRRSRERLAQARERRSDTRGVRGWLAEVESMEGVRRSFLFEVIARLIFHVVMVWSVFLLFAGHNNPGGGFAAGLVGGLALAIRYLAGGRGELRAALPVMPGLLLGSGLFLSAGFGVVSMLVGGDVLQSWAYDVPVPLVGDVHLVTSLFFDLGVYLVVIGLMLDILRSLGAALDTSREVTPA